ncbi:MAG: entericidin A/B family lipoprotein [Acetobacteraceae bacterium]
MRAKLMLALTIATLLGGASLLSACNTMEGAGQDLQAGGRSLENSAERNR